MLAGTTVVTQHPILKSLPILKILVQKKRPYRYGRLPLRGRGRFETCPYLRWGLLLLTLHRLSPAAGHDERAGYHHGCAEEQYPYQAAGGW